MPVAPGGLPDREYGEGALNALPLSLIRLVSAYDFFSRRKSTPLPAAARPMTASARAR